MNDGPSEASKKGKQVESTYEQNVQQTNLQRRIGLLTFMGDLYNAEIVPTALLDALIKGGLAERKSGIDEVNLEALCRMMPIVGVKYEARFEVGRNMQHHVQQLKRLVQSGTLPSRLKTMVKVSIPSLAHGG